MYQPEKNPEGHAPNIVHLDDLVDSLHLDNLINAKEARKKAENNAYIRIISSINDAIKRGEYASTYYGEIPATIKNKLENKGYAVDLLLGAGSVFSNSTYRISW